MDRRGFSLTETVLAVVLTIVIGLVVIINLSQRKGTSDLNVATREIASFLRQAQANSVSGIGGSGWGVHFANPTTSGNYPSYTFFSGAAYVATATGNQTFRLPATVSYTTSSVAQGPSGRDILFAQVSGAASASTGSLSITLFITARPTYSSTITISPTGAITF